MLIFKDEDICLSKEKYLLVLCNCVELQEPDGIVHSIYQQFPWGNIYQERKLSGKSYKPGTIDIKGNGQSERFVLNILAQFYVGISDFPNDDHVKRAIWFKKALAQISEINHLVSLAIHIDNIMECTGPRHFDAYIEALSDLSKSLALRGLKDIQIVVYGRQPPKQDQEDLKIPFCDLAEKHHAEKHPFQDGRERVKLTNVVTDVVLRLAHFRHLKVAKTETTSDMACTMSGAVTDMSAVTPCNITMTVTDIRPQTDFNQWKGLISEIPESIPGWNNIFIDAQLQQELGEIDKFFEQELKECNEAKIAILPPQNLIFNVFSLCPFHSIKVVILAQDPYINLGDRKSVV